MPTRILLERVLKVAEDPKVTQLLTKKEAENGLEIVIERIVEDMQK